MYVQDLLHTLSHTSSVSSVLLSTTYTILLVIQVIGSDSANSDDGYKYAAYLHQSYKWFTYCNKNAICVPNGQVLILKAYKTYKKIVDPVSNILLFTSCQVIARLPRRP